MTFSLDRNEIIPAVVFGLFETGLGVIRSLGQKDIPVVGIDYKKDIAWHSRYTKPLLCPHPVMQENQFITWIKNMFDGCEFIMPAFFTSDDFLTTISKHRSIFGSYFKYNIADHALLCQIGDKYKQYLAAIAAGTKAPNTIFIYNMEDMQKLDLKDFTFPVFLKGLDVVSWRSLISSSIKGYRFDTEETLRTSAKNIICKGVPIIIQELIQGPDTNHYKYCSYTSRSGKVLAEFTLQKIRQNPIHFGIGSVVESLSDNELLGEGRKLFTGINFRGIGSAEFKRDSQDGKLKLIEINPRYWQQNYLSTTCGLNMAYINYCDLIEKQTNCSNSYRTGVKWVNIYSDFKSYLNYNKEESLTFRDWKTSLKGPKVYADFTWDDPGPAFFSAISNSTKLARLLIGKSSDSKR